MPRTLGAKKSNLFAQIFNQYEVNLSEFAQINDGLFDHVYFALGLGIPGSEYLARSLMKLNRLFNQSPGIEKELGGKKRGKHENAILHTNLEKNQTEHLTVLKP